MRRCNDRRWHRRSHGCTWLEVVRSQLPDDAIQRRAVLEWVLHSRCMPLLPLLLCHCQWLWRLRSLVVDERLGADLHAGVESPGGACHHRHGEAEQHECRERHPAAVEGPSRLSHGEGQGKFVRLEERRQQRGWVAASGQALRQADRNRSDWWRARCNWFEGQLSSEAVG